MLWGGGPQPTKWKFVEGKQKNDNDLEDEEEHDPFNPDVTSEDPNLASFRWLDFGPAFFSSYNMITL